MRDINLIIDKDFILTEGAIIERIVHELQIDLNSPLLNAVLALDDKKKQIMEHLYKEYIDVALEFGIPILVFTPTWKVNEKSCNQAKEKLSNVIHICCEFMNNIKKEYEFNEKIYIGGLIGGVNDSYNPSLSLSKNDSYNFHKKTVNEFEKNGKYIDFLIASTLPSLTESFGIAKAISESSIPYFLSFVIRDTGEILDGNLLINVIEYIDNNIKNIPCGYMINCVHPHNVICGLRNNENLIPNSKKKYICRIRGIQGNTSKLPPEELNNSFKTIKEDPQEFAHEMYKLKSTYNFNILGGCCGTDKSHIYSIAKLFANNP